MSSYYRDVAARFRRRAAEAQAAKTEIDGKITKLKNASSKLATEIQSIGNKSRSLGQIIPLDSTSFKGSRQEDFEAQFYALGTHISNFCISHSNNKTAIDDKIRTLQSESEGLQSTINSYYRQARIYDCME